jgi:hypothetical protein
MIDTGGNAFPSEAQYRTVNGDWSDEPERGMSLLDWFAGLAMQGMVSDPNCVAGDGQVATYAYEYARQMLVERERLGAK